MKDRKRTWNPSTAVSPALLTLLLVLLPLTHLTAAQMSQPEINKARELLDAIGKSGLIFIRNGKEYTAVEAKDHLKTKLDWARDKVSTAQEFVEKVASRSLMTGEPYLIKLPDARTLPAREWLLQELGRIEEEHRKLQESAGP